MRENKCAGLRNYNAVAISAFPLLLNVRTIGRSKWGWRMHSLSGWCGTRRKLSGVAGYAGLRHSD
jgi:hypothetical protein